MLSRVLDSDEHIKRKGFDSLGGIADSDLATLAAQETKPFMFFGV